MSAPFDLDALEHELSAFEFWGPAREGLPRLFARVRELEAERDALRELARELVTEFGTTDDDDDFDDEESCKARCIALGVLPTEGT